MKRLGLLLCGLFLVGAVLAAPMDGEPTSFVQPNGQEISLLVYGDEYYAETRTTNGYTVVFDSKVKAYFYARLSADGAELVATTAMVGRDAVPPGLAKEISISGKSRREKAQRRKSADESQLERERAWIDVKPEESSTRATFQSTGAGLDLKTLNIPAGSSGRQVGLTVLVEFPDDPRFHSRQQIDDYCNLEGYSEFNNDGSVYDYFFGQSGGRLRYYNMVTPYVMAPHPKPYYNDIEFGSGTAGRKLVGDVLDILVKQGYDFSAISRKGNGRIRAFNLFFAGNNSGVWAKGLWPNRYSLSSAVDVGNGISVFDYQITNLGNSLKLGTFCHENGHLLLGYPDLYDTSGQSSGVGKYSAMSSSGSTSLVNFGAYLRYKSGWGELVELNPSSHFRGAARVDHGALYRYKNPAKTSEYFLLENRQQKAGLEVGSPMPDSGLMFMHCDERGAQKNSAMTEAEHYKVSIEQADGLFHLERKNNRGGPDDLFHNADFSDTTLPNARWWKNATTNTASGDPSGLKVHKISETNAVMTFIVGDGPLTSAPALGVDTAQLQIRTYFDRNPTAQQVAVWNMGGGTLNYRVEPQVPWITASAQSGHATQEADLIDLAFNSSALAPAATHTGKVRFVNQDNPSEVHILTIQLTIEAPPALRVAPQSLDLEVTGGRRHRDVSVQIFNTGGSLLNYTITTDVPWLSTEAASGTVGGEIDIATFTADAMQLQAGHYTGEAIITSEAGEQVAIEVRLHVKDLGILTPGGSVLSPGRNIPIRWRHSSAIAQVDIELWRNGQFHADLVRNTENDGEYVWPLLANQFEPGSGYTIRIRGVGDSTTSESLPFEINNNPASFETDFDEWVNAADGETEWIRHSDKTSSLHTGPPNASDGQYYLYLEASNNNGLRAHLTKTFNLTGLSSPKLRFDYFMYGSAIGSLHLDIQKDGIWTKDVWVANGQQHLSDTVPWSTAEIDLAPWAGNDNITLRLRGVVGNSFSGDIAIDKIEIDFGPSSTLLQLKIASLHGTPTPAVGQHHYPSDSWIEASVDSPILNGGTQYVATGWTLISSTTNAGSSNAHAFTLTQPATLTWNWRTNYYLTIGPATNGSVNQSSAWLAANSRIWIRATPDPYYHFEGWGGDITATVNPKRLKMTRSKTLWPRFAPDLLTNNVPAYWMAQYGLGTNSPALFQDPDHDGHTSWEEYLAGTDPTNQHSVLRIMRAVPAEHGLEIAWQAVAGKQYAIHSTTNLLQDAWTQSTNAIPGTEPLCVHTVKTDTATGFIRIEVEEE